MPNNTWRNSTGLAPLISSIFSNLSNVPHDVNLSFPTKKLLASQTHSWSGERCWKCTSVDYRRWNPSITARDCQISPAMIDWADFFHSWWKDRSWGSRPCRYTTASVWWKSCVKSLDPTLYILEGRFTGEITGTFCLLPSLALLKKILDLITLTDITLQSDLESSYTLSRAKITCTLQHLPGLIVLTGYVSEINLLEFLTVFFSCFIC